MEEVFPDVRSCVEPYNWSSQKAFFFFFSPLLSLSGSVCKALKKPELPFEKWCFIFISEASFGLDLHLKVKGFLFLHY